MSIVFAFLVIVSSCQPAEARGMRGGGQKQQKTVQAVDQNEEQYEAGLADVCDQRDQQRSKDAAAGKVSFYSEECLPISVQSRRAKRAGEKKHFATCESKRKDQRAAAAKKTRVHLAVDCFNWIPDAALEVDMPEPADPFFTDRPGGLLKSATFLECGKGPKSEQCKTLKK